ncbi:hypothetical protein [Halorubrum tebenquichense]|uniref:Uncharacterized protein n=1 Tax=Halorubrum tebenquichense DSM 14210 TaxID=1227485 RepID=M0DY51_9EURY|nr:hypothetical protein [Halorubrum tebenquichense]ELZ38994.1 hypothetical protein C472_05616 [Halorubrum tebenquichense DSM 14210]
MPEVVDQDEQTIEVAGHTCRQIAVETGTSVLSKFECVDCGASTNSVTTFDQLDCETGEFDRPEEIGEPPAVDMCAHHDVDAIVSDLKDIEAVLDVEMRREPNERVGALSVRLDGDYPTTGTIEIGSVLRDHGLVINAASISPTGDLMIRLAHPEVSRFAA